MKLFEKASIGKMELQNRIIMCPMGVSTDTDGGFSQRSIRYYEERAKGGAGLIITGYSSESEKYEKSPCNVLDNFSKVARAHELVQRVHMHGAKVCMQLGPGLGNVYFIDANTSPYSSCDTIESVWFEGLKCKTLTKEDIASIVEAVGFSASLAKQAEADAVELRVYGGYLADQFMSTKWNKRTDEYGGELENRMRFPLECLASIKKYCGDDYPVIVKFNPYHAVPDGRQLSEGLEIAKMFEAAGAHALHLDKGCYDCWYNAITTVYQPDAHQIDLAEAVKKVVKIPVIAQGKLNNPVVAERVLQEGKTDFVALGHQLLADAHWSNKVKEGKIQDIIPCIGCNECLSHFFAGKHLNCAVNPESFHEAEYSVDPVKTKKNVLVIGGGPGGMEAALTASIRGHNVTLWEKDAQLGGLLLAAGAPSFKSSVMDYVKYIIKQVESSDVDVRLLTEATEGNVLAGGFDEVIIATGARSLIPPIDGIKGSQVHSSTDVLIGKAGIKGTNVVVIGGGLVGCETAVQLALEGKNVTIVEILDDLLLTAEHCMNNDQALKALIAENNVKACPGAKVVAIKKDGVDIEKEGKTSTIACEEVVLACGYRSNNELAKQLEGKVKIKVIGDSVAPRKILTAVHEGFHVGRLID